MLYRTISNAEMKLKNPNSFNFVKRADGAPCVLIEADPSFSRVRLLGETNTFAVESYRIKPENEVRQ
jgi:hypothetical protein